MTNENAVQQTKSDTYMYTKASKSLEQTPHRITRQKSLDLKVGCKVESGILVRKTSIRVSIYI